MSIASRISAMQEHLRDDYDVLNLAGADLTNVDKNIVNLKPTWKERLLYFINNGTDEVWENWDKVTGEGTSLTLNNTLEAKMKIVLKGNTYQEGTPTPESPQDIHVVSGDNSIEVCGKNIINFGNVSGNGIVFDTSEITVTNPTNYKYADTWNLKNDTSLSGGTYTIYAIANGTTDGSKSVSLIIGKTGNAYAFNMQLPTTQTTYTNFEKIGTVTLGDNETFQNCSIFVSGSMTASLNIKVMVVKGSYTSSTIGEYEPYKSASYPISLGVLSKNLFDSSTIVAGEITGANPNVRLSSRQNLWIEAGTYTFSTNGSSPFRYALYVENAGKPPLSSYPEYILNTGWLTSSTYTFTINEAGYFVLGVSKENNASLTVAEISSINYQLEKGTSASTYERYNPLELCKIGTYQDKIDKSTGINKLAPTQSFNETINSVKFTGDNGVYTINGTASANTRPTYKDITPYTIQSGDYLHIMNNWSGNAYIFLKIGNTDYSPSLSSTNRIMDLSSYAGQTITQISFQVQSGTSINAVITPMILNTNTATSYEPYGTGWYLKKEIGKVVLDGTEAGWNRTGTSTSGNYYFFINSFLSNVLYSSNRFIGLSNIGVTTNAYNGVEGADTILYNSVSVTRVYTDTTKNMSIDDFKTWISSNNVTLYYVLVTPTYETITDTTLISQLEKLSNAKSYNQQTNIFQSNNDNASIMNASALQNM